MALTWNMQGKMAPSAEQLREWDIAQPGTHHVLAFGSEECERSIGASVLNTSKASWESSLSKALGNEYCVVAARTLQAIHLIVFVHRALLPTIGDVQVGAVATGMDGTLGNKGGVAIGFSLGNTSILFINCHLHAGSKAKDADKRNADANAIDAGLTLCPVNAHPAIRSKKLASQRYDRVVLMGDLNYRCNATREDADQMLRSRNL